MSHNFEYSDRYSDSEYEYRHVVVSKSCIGRIPVKTLMLERDWRAIGVCQSAGWMHYAIHLPERHILLFKRPRGYSELSPSEQRKWEHRSEALVRERNLELSRARGPLTRSYARQALKERNTKGSINENEKEISFGLPADLFY